MHDVVTGPHRSGIIVVRRSGMLFVRKDNKLGYVRKDNKLGMVRDDYKLGDSLNRVATNEHCQTPRSGIYGLSPLRH